MTIIIDQKRVKEKLIPYGLIDIKSIKHQETQTHIADLLPLSLILQNIIAITAAKLKFKVSSGIIFNARNADENVKLKK